MSTFHYTWSLIEEEQLLQQTAICDKIMSLGKARQPYIRSEKKNP